MGCKNSLREIIIFYDRLSVIKAAIADNNKRATPKALIFNYKYVKKVDKSDIIKTRTS